MGAAPGRKPWKTANPRKKDGTSQPLSPAQKAESRARARNAGRRYPNLVDNMAVARTSPTRRVKAKKKAAR